MATGRERQERRRVARRVAIRSVAIRLALEHGPDAVTVEMISEAADVSTRTFFNYFRAKGDAFSIEPHQWTTEEIVGELRRRPETEAPAESMRYVIQAMADAAGFDQFGEQWEQLQQLYGRHPELFARLRPNETDATMAALADEVARRRGSDPAGDLYPLVLVGAAFAALQAAENNVRGTGRPLSAALDEAFDLLVHGL